MSQSLSGHRPPSPPPRPRTSLLAAATITVALGAGCPCGDDDGVADEIVLIRDPSPTIQMLMQRCMDPVQPDCVPLCQQLTNQRQFVHCEMHQDRDGYQQVHIGYHDEAFACY